uniref:Major facilitator superfamily (MFS) profile domain-containing protein n=1 Tax=Leptobrachium leishanense TaxID=445787 RepID=A0A8C5R7P2_9ANUR
MGFNDLLEKVGGVGRFQILNTAMLLLPMFYMACHNFLQNFSAAVPAHRCKVPLIDNGTTGYNHGAVISFIPVIENQKLVSCLRYKNAQFGIWTNNSSANVTEPCEDGWVYDKTIFSSTVITEWDLVCNFQKMKQIAQSIYMAGVLVGAVLLGGLSDRFGRKKLLIGSYLAMALFGTCVAFLPKFVYYCIFRFLCGMAFSGIALNTISLILEWMPPKGRTVAGTLFAYSFTVGQVQLAGLAYAIRDWRWLQFTVFSTSFVFYGLSTDLQKFDMSIFLLQLVFGGVDIPAKLLCAISMSHLGRRVTQCACLILAGVTMLAIAFVPQGEILVSSQNNKETNLKHKKNLNDNAAFSC